MYKYIVGKKQKHLIVSEKVHQMIQQYARDSDLTMVEATYKLLKMAFGKVYNLEKSDKQ